MKFSISLTSGTDKPVSAAEIQAFAKSTEALGFHGIYVTDHFYHNNPNFHSVSAAAVLCAATKHLQIGFSAYQVPLRHPIVVAKEFAMLDALSEGRLVTAFATGSYEKEFEALGIPFNQRGKMLDEGIRAIRRLWENDMVSFCGDFWSFKNVSVTPKPVQKPRMPIWIASWSAGGRPAARVAEFGDGWQASGLHTPIEQLSTGWSHIMAECDLIKRDPATIKRAYVNTVVHFGSSPESAWNDFISQSDKNSERHRELCLMGNEEQICTGIDELQGSGMEEISFLLGVGEADKAGILAADIIPRF